MTKRILTGVGLIALLTFALYMGGWVFAVLCTAAICLTVFEMYRALTHAGHRPIQWPVWAGMVASIPSFMLYGSGALLPIMASVCMIVSALVLFRARPSLTDILISLMPLFALSLPGMCMLAFLMIEPKALQVVYLCMAWAIPVAGDTLAYFVGSRIGKTKLIPEVSPNKTVAGAVAGLCGSVLAAVVIYLVGSIWTSALPPFWHFPILGLVGGVAGQLGDLFASLVKRHCKVKDYGSIFPGHGGMMDRLDSVFFATVVVYLYHSLTTVL